jgi:hypothetical protein
LELVINIFKVKYFRLKHTHTLHSCISVYSGNTKPGFLHVIMGVGWSSCLCFGLNLGPEHSTLFLYF